LEDGESLFSASMVDGDSLWGVCLVLRNLYSPPEHLRFASYYLIVTHQVWQCWATTMEKDPFFLI